MMTDYLKLKEAHSLAEIYSKQTDSNCEISFCCQQSNRNPYIRFRWGEPGHKFDFPFELDDLITKLRELTTRAPKYKEAWYLGEDNNSILLTKVHNQVGYSCCDDTDIGALGRTMYPSKKALIDAQIEYWSGLKLEHQDKEPNYCEPEEECEHEMDYHHRLLNPLQIKCNKCGEFYR